VIACTDVHYVDDHAAAACLLFPAWTDSVPARQFRIEMPEASPYVPGQFYLRELPCLLAVLRLANEPLDAIFV